MNDGEGEAGREGGDEGIIVPIVTPTTVTWLWRVVEYIRDKVQRRG